MPYASLSDLPEGVKKLSEAAQKQWLEVFNSIMAETDDEERAFAGAWSVVNQAKLARLVLEVKSVTVVAKLEHKGDEPGHPLRGNQYTSEEDRGILNDPRFQEASRRTDEMLDPRSRAAGLPESLRKLVAAKREADKGKTGAKSAGGPAELKADGLLLPEQLAETMGLEPSQAEQLAQTLLGSELLAQVPNPQLVELLGVLVKVPAADEAERMSWLEEAEKMAAAAADPLGVTADDLLEAVLAALEAALGEPEAPPPAEQPGETATDTPSA